MFDIFSVVVRAQELPANANGGGTTYREDEVAVETARPGRQERRGGVGASPQVDIFGSQ